MKLHAVPRARHPVVSLLATFLVLAGCGSGGGEPEVTTDGNFSMSVRSTPLSPGDADCPHGGILVKTGIDENGNSMLDEDEVDRTEKVCNGAPGADGDAGLSALVKTGDESPGANCPAGGIRIDSGLDDDGDGILAPGEINATFYLCNGIDGAAGPRGPVGADGSDGLNSLVAFHDEPSGVNCPWGGMRVESGLDADGDGILQPGEVSETRFICSLIEGSIGWQVGEVIDGGDGNASSPQIAVAADGTAFAVWVHFSAENIVAIWANRYVPGGGWGSPQVLYMIVPPFPVQPNAGPPQIAVARNGTAVAVWRLRQFRDSPGDIWASLFVPGSGWGAERIIETGSGHAESPRVAMDPGGTAIIVWRQETAKGSSIHDIWAKRFVPGSGWSSPQKIESAGGDAESPQIAMSPDGSAIVVWKQETASGSSIHDIWAKHFMPGSGWGVAQRIESGSGTAGNPVVAMDPDGAAIAAWEQGDGTRNTVWVNRFVPGSGWGSPQKIETGGGDAESPRVAMGPGGLAIAVWRQWDAGGNRWDLWSNRYDPATGWGTAERIEHRAGSVGGSAITMAADGSAIALWVQWDGSRNAIWSNRFMPGVGWGVAQPVEHNAEGNTDAPRIALDGDGNAIAVWTQESADGTRTDIRANRWLAP